MPNPLGDDNKGNASSQNYAYAEPLDKPRWLFTHTQEDNFDG